MSDPTAYNPPRADAGPGAPGEAGSGGTSAPDAALEPFENLDTLATVSFRGATNLKDLLRLASRHCRRLVDSEIARIWLARRNGRRLVARDFAEDGRAEP